MAQIIDKSEKAERIQRLDEFTKELEKLDELVSDYQVKERNSEDFYQNKDQFDEYIMKLEQWRDQTLAKTHKEAVEVRESPQNPENELEIEPVEEFQKQYLEGNQLLEEANEGMQNIR